MVYFVSRDSCTPCWLRWLAIGIVAYALSPIDLIPDFIPILGLLDELILLPAGIALILKLTPAEVIQRAQQRSAERIHTDLSRWVAVVIVMLWLVAVGWITIWWLR